MYLSKQDESQKMLQDGLKKYPGFGVFIDVSIYPRPIGYADGLGSGPNTRLSVLVTSVFGNFSWSQCNVYLVILYCGMVRRFP